jgi:hypothetical protein
MRCWGECRCSVALGWAIPAMLQFGKVELKTDEVAL